MAVALAGTAATTGTTAASTTHTVNLPASIVSGETLLMVCLVADINKYFTATGWTSEYTFNATGGGCALQLLSRVADGGEGSTVTLTVAPSGSSQCTAICGRFTGVDQANITHSANYVNNQFASSTTLNLAANTLTGVISGNVVLYALSTEAVRTITTWDSNGFLTNIGQTSTASSLHLAYDTAPGTGNRNYITTINSARAMDYLVFEIAASGGGGGGFLTRNYWWDSY